MSALVTSSDKEFVIRRGGKEDCPAILDFVRTTIPLAVGHGALGRLTMNFSIPQQIQQLADYEKEPDAVEATVETLEENVFNKGYAEVLIAEQHKDCSVVSVGMVLYFYSFSTWTSKPSLYLEDLFVIPTLRNKGVGKLLFKALGQIAQQKDCARIDWSVLKWNAPTIAFYEKVLGAKPMDEWKGMRLEQQGIANLSKLI
ncbi:related to n-acetyltransferase [Ustilago bromivora]|uniref:Related to n-acetyltransferase n=1 Tax=Ustilago bromivora TaxID=307758 RepID=A0A8H8QPT3_9BASI|nr:related to n-acetyltransferase [Ustilago bromivora]